MPDESSLSPQLFQGTQSPNASPLASRILTPSQGENLNPVFLRGSQAIPAAALPAPRPSTPPPGVQDVTVPSTPCRPKFTPPPTPLHPSLRRAKKPEAKPLPYVVGANRVAESMKKKPVLNGEVIEEKFVPFSISIGNRSIQVTEHIKTFTSGTYYDAYLVKVKGLRAHVVKIKGPGEDPRQEETVVLKVLKEEWREKPKDVSNIVRDEFEQYPELKDKFPAGSIAEHFDFEIVLKQMNAWFNHKDPAQSMPHGCHFVRYIPNEYPIAKHIGQLFPEGTKERAADDQLQALFVAAAAANELGLDLTWGNVGIDANGKLVVFDPTTPNPGGDPFDKDSFMGQLVDRALKSFAPEGSERWNYLLKGLYPSISYC